MYKGVFIFLPDDCPASSLSYAQSDVGIKTNFCLRVCLCPLNNKRPCFTKRGDATRVPTFHIQIALFFYIPRPKDH